MRLGLKHIIVLTLGACAGAGHGETGSAGGGDNPPPPPQPGEPGTAFRRIDLVSDQQGVAPVRDTDVVNAWGIAVGEGGFWIANEASGKLLVFDATGKPLTGEYGPITLGEGITGVAANPTDGFMVFFDDGGCEPADFVVASMTGQLFGVSVEGRGHTAALVDRAGMAAYTGVAIGREGDSPRLYAANFAGGHIDVFDGDLREVQSPGAFVDPDLPADYSPFNVAVFGERVYVAYAVHHPDEPSDEVAGPGLGIIDVYANTGAFVGRLATGGELDAPWGLAIAPAGFGDFGGMLLVGNFGNGLIHAFDLASGRVAGALSDPSGAPLEIDGLWGITFGGGEGKESAGDPNVLYFAAGPGDESHGLFGRIELAQ